MSRLLRRMSAAQLLVASASAVSNPRQVPPSDSQSERSRDGAFVAMLDAGFQGSGTGGLASFAKIFAGAKDSQNAQNAKDPQYANDATEARALWAPRGGGEACTESPQCKDCTLR